MADTTQSPQPTVQSQPRPLWSHVWPFIAAQWRDTGWGLALTLLGIGASLLQPWPMQINVDSILTDKAPLPVSGVACLAESCE